MTVQILEREGAPEYAVIPYADYEAMRDAAEMLNDISAYNKAKQEIENGKDEVIPFEFTERLLAGANPVAAWRKYRGMTQAALADRVSVSQAAIAGIEGGKREPSVSLLKRLATVLGVDMDDLVEY